MFLIDRIHNHLKEQYNLSYMDSIKLKYSMEVIFNELSKLITLSIVFAIMGYAYDFLYSVIALMLIRPFTGGLHLKTYTKCTVFTGAFFTLSVFLKNIVNIKTDFLIFLFIVPFLTFSLFAPVTGENRPIFSKTKKFKFKITSISIVLLHSIAFMFTKNHPYLENSVWVIFLQSIQLLIAEGVKIYAEKTISYKIG